MNQKNQDNNTTKDTRDDRLNDALRQNLKRRKQAPKPGLHRPKKS